MVAEVGFEPHDLRVMSPTSYQAALLRDIWFGAGNGNRTRTILSYHGILSPGRLPIPPFRRSGRPLWFPLSLYIISPLISIVNTFLKKAEKVFCKFFFAVLFAVWGIDILFAVVYNIIC